MFETGRLSTTEDLLQYKKTSFSSFIEMMVLVRNRGDLDHQTMLAKGRYGYVNSVDSERRTARVALNESEDVFSLRSLISL